MTQSFSHEPTVLDLVEFLCRALPAPHLCCELALELLEDIDRPNASDEAQGKELSFERAFNEFRQSVRSHRLHADILSNSIFNHSLLDIDGTACPSFEIVGMKLTVSLERYIGDVLCAYYLIGHSTSTTREVDGCLTEDKWINSLLSLRPTNAYASTYHSWVFLHSTLLRTAPFTREQRLRLGIASPLDMAQGSRPLPFGLRPRRKIVKALRYLDKLQPLRTCVSSSVGDLVQTQTIHPQSFTKLIHAFIYYIKKPLPSYESIFPKWTNGEQPIFQWLLRMHQEAVKTRPMTVFSPFVTIKCNFADQAFCEKDSVAPVPTLVTAHMR